MKIRSLVIVLVILMFGITAYAGQNAQGTINRGVGPDASGRMPITQSSRLEVLNQGDIFFDINLNNKTSVLYMGNSPVYTFSVRVVKQFKQKRRVRAQEYVLTGNTAQRLIIDEGQGVIFLKIKKLNGGVKKLIISRISVQKFPNNILRYRLNDNVNLMMHLNHNNGLLNSTFAFKGMPIFIMTTGYEMLQGRRNMNVLQLKGNAAGGLYFNRSNQTLYYKSPKKSGVWTKVRRVRK